MGSRGSWGGLRRVRGSAGWGLCGAGGGPGRAAGRAAAPGSEEEERSGGPQGDAHPTYGHPYCLLQVRSGAGERQSRSVWRAGLGFGLCLRWWAWETRLVRAPGLARSDVVSSRRPHAYAVQGRPAFGVQNHGGALPSPFQLSLSHTSPPLARPAELAARFLPRFAAPAGCVPAECGFDLPRCGRRPARLCEQAFCQFSREAR